MERHLTKQELATRLIELRGRVDGPVVEVGAWDDLMEFLGDALAIPDEYLYAERQASTEPTPPEREPDLKAGSVKVGLRV